MRNGLKNILLKSTTAVAALSLCVVARAQGPASEHITIQFSPTAGPGGMLSCSTAAGSNGFSATSWSFGGQNPTNTNTNAAGKVALQDLAIAKAFDECSPTIFKGFVAGTHFESIVLTQSDGNNKPIMTVQLTNPVVSNYQLAGTTSGSPGEVIAFAFDRITIADTQSGVKSCWDTKQVKPC